MTLSSSITRRTLFTIRRWLKSWARGRPRAFFFRNVVQQVIDRRLAIGFEVENIVQKAPKNGRASIEGVIKVKIEDSVILENPSCLADDLCHILKNAIELANVWVYEETSEIIQ